MNIVEVFEDVFTTELPRWPKRGQLGSLVLA
jgi:hypothetical protein